MGAFKTEIGIRSGYEHGFRCEGRWWKEVEDNEWLEEEENCCGVAVS